MSWLVRLALVLALGACVTSNARAADDAARSVARKLAVAGVESLEQGDATTAVDKLRKAYAVLHVPSVGLWLARALVKQGKLVEGSEQYQEVLRVSSFEGEQEIQQKAQRDADSELAALQPRIPTLVLNLSGDSSEASVKIDGRPVPAALVREEQPVNAGRHRITAQAGGQEASANVDVAEGEHKQVSLVLRSAQAATAAPPAPTTGPGATPAASSEPGPAAPDASPSRPKSAKRTLGYVAVSLGAAGLIAGGVTGALVLQKKTELEESGDCVAQKCDYSQQSEVEGYRTLRIVSTASFIAGGVLGALGVTLLVTSSPASETQAAGSHVALRLAPGHVAVSGSF